MGKRKRKKGSKRFVYSVVDGPGYGKLVGTYTRRSGFEPNFHGSVDLTMKPGALPARVHVEAKGGAS